MGRRSVVLAEANSSASILDTDCLLSTSSGTKATGGAANKNILYININKLDLA